MASTTPASRSAAKAAYDEGYRLGTDGDYHRALAKFREAVELDPKLAIAWFDLGGLSEQMGDIDGAVAAFEKCVAVLPTFAHARVELATLYLTQQQKPEEARSQIRAALTTAEPFVDRRFSLAHTRGQGLHNLAISFAVLEFRAAAASVSRSLMSDPKAIPDSNSPRIAQMAQHDVDLSSAKGAEVDRLQREADAAVAAKTFDVADERLSRAMNIAREVSLDRWLDLAYAQVVVRVRATKLDDAMKTFEELAWLEFVTRHDPARGPSRAARASADGKLAPLHRRSDFAAAVRTYHIGER